jgi:hypothetical protein
MKSKNLVFKATYARDITVKWDQVVGSPQYNWGWVNSPADGKKEFDEAIIIKLDYGW